MKPENEKLARKAERKVALVSGSSTGIGANIAVDLAATGHYFVIVTGRDMISLQRVVSRCNEAASKNLGNGIVSACAFRADLRDYQQLDKLVDFVKTEFQRLDLLVNNACWRGQFASPLDKGDESFEDFRNVMHLNVSVPMYIIHKCLIPLRRQATTSDGGQIVEAIVINISSIASQTVVPLHSYSISKACLSELSRQLTDSARDLGILSVTISPGPVLTDERPHHQMMSNLTLMNRVGSTQEISNLVLFAVNHAPLLNGQEVNIDGGYLAKQRLVGLNCGQYEK